MLISDLIEVEFWCYEEEEHIRARTPQQQQNTIDSESGTGITGFGIFIINRKKVKTT